MSKLSRVSLFLTQHTNAYKNMQYNEIKNTALPLFLYSWQTNLSIREIKKGGVRGKREKRSFPGPPPPAGAEPRTRAAAAGGGVLRRGALRRVNGRASIAAACVTSYVSIVLPPGDVTLTARSRFILPVNPARVRFNFWVLAHNRTHFYAGLITFSDWRSARERVETRLFEIFLMMTWFESWYHPQHTPYSIYEVGTLYGHLLRSTSRKR